MMPSDQGDSHYPNLKKLFKIFLRLLDCSPVTAFWAFFSIWWTIVISKERAQCEMKEQVFKKLSVNLCISRPAHNFSTHKGWEVLSLILKWLLPHAWETKSGFKQLVHFSLSVWLEMSFYDWWTTYFNWMLYFEHKLEHELEAVLRFSRSLALNSSQLHMPRKQWDNILLHLPVWQSNKIKHGVVPNGSGWIR